MKTVALSELQFAELIQPGERIGCGHGTAEPTALLEMLLAQRAEVSGTRLFMHTTVTGVVKPEHADHLQLEAIGAVGHRHLTQARVLRLIPAHLSDMPGLLCSGALRVDVALLQVAGPDGEGRYSLGVLNDYQVTMARAARLVIAQLNPSMPFTRCEPWLSAEDIDILVLTDRHVPQVPVGEPTATEIAIARFVAGFIGDGAILQFGIGGIPDAVLAQLHDRQHLGLHSGLLPDSALALLQSGAVNNSSKRVDRGLTITGGVWGTQPFYDYCARSPDIVFRAIEHTHAPATFTQLPGFVSINTALEVDLSGQVNIEMAGDHYIGAIGGAVDFVRGARLSANGRSIIALPSAARAGAVSRIVPRLANGTVTVPRSDVDTVVTEYGVAELRGCSLEERARRLIDIAHPDARAGLVAAARK